MSNLKATIKAASISALKAGEKQRLMVIRLILAALQLKEVDERLELTDAHVVSVLDKMCKQRQDSLAQFVRANRTDLADQEKFELAVIAEFVPAKMSVDATQAVIDQVLSQTGASGLASIGAVMGALKPMLAGKADMGWVSKRVKEMLA